MKRERHSTRTRGKLSRPRLPYRLLSSARGSRPLSIDFPSDSVSHHSSYLGLIVLSHLHLIYNCTYKQHTYTHPLRSLDLPRLSPLSVFLSIVCFLVITPAPFLDPVILCWLPRPPCLFLRLRLCLALSVPIVGV